MKPLASTITNTGTLPGHSQAMGIDAKNMAHLMSVLTNLYSDPVAAVLREYSTNAFDAHVEAGVKRPIRVSLPSSLNPTLLIEDFGVGMSTDDLINLFSSYGASTKRGTNEQTGMLGLGSKSALAITSQFTVRSRKGGVETTALIFLNDDGGGEIKIVDTRATNETGTLIQMGIDSIKYVRSFDRAAENLFRYWPVGSVECATLPTSVYADEKITWLNDAIGIDPKQRYYQGTVTVVQGNVPYPVDYDSLDEETKTAYRAIGLDHHNLVVIAPIGTLQFTPSREALYYTTNTNKGLRDLFAQYAPAMRAKVESDLASAKSRTEAMEVAEKWAKYDLGSFSWNGQAIPTTVDCACAIAENRKHSNADYRKSLPTLSSMKSYAHIVVNVTTNDTYALRSAIGKHTGDGMLDKYGYYSSTSSTKVLFIFGPKPEGWDWFDLPTIEWSDFGKVNRKGRTNIVSQAGIDYTQREWKLTKDYRPVKVTDEGEGFVYVTGDEREYVRERVHSTAFTFVNVSANMVSNFTKAFPKAMSVNEAKRHAAEQISKASTTEYRKSLSVSSSEVLGLIDRTKVLDSNLRSVLELIEKAKKDRSKIEAEAAKYRGLASIHEAVLPYPEWEKARKDYGHILVHTFGRMSKAQATDLVNALYTYKHQGE